MATPPPPPPPERPKPPLHNFSLPHLKWGTQRILKCMKLPTTPGNTSPQDPSRPSPLLQSSSRTVRPKPNSASSEEESARPWNLRTRRAACNAPPLALALAQPMGLRQGGGINVGLLGAAGGEVKKRRKFAVALTREEVELDFAKIVGCRPPRRPKKRPRVLRKQLDSIFPGLWLTEVAVDTYKVLHVPE